MTISPSDSAERAAKCRAFRLSKKIPLREIAYQYGCSTSYVFKAETGQRNFPDALVMVYVDAGMPVEVKI